MYINLDKFYSSNYRDFVHRQALEDALKLVAEIYLKDTKVDTILNITFSVDEYGENPIYLTYLDEEKKEHIVKLKPNITEALLERLKEYAKITYVDEQDEKLRQELTQIIEQSKIEAIDTANNFTISHTNEVKNDILNIINQTSDDLREYCDNKCEMTLLAGKNYTDAKADEINQRIDEEHEYNQERYVIGTINKDGLDTGKRFTEIGITPNKKQYAHLVNFVDARNNQHEINHASGYLLNYDGYTNLVTNLSKAGIPIYLTMQDGTPLFVSEISFLANEFTNQDFISAELKDGVNDVRGFLINQENLEKLYSLDLSLYATKEELNSLDSKVDLVNQQVEVNKEAISDYTTRASNLFDDLKIPNRYWYFGSYTPKFERLILEGDYLRTYTAQNGKADVITYTPTFKVEDKIEESKQLYATDETNRRKINGDVTIHYNGDNITKLSMRPDTTTETEKTVDFTQNTGGGGANITLENSIELPDLDFSSNGNSAYEVASRTDGDVALGVLTQYQPPLLSDDDGYTHTTLQLEHNPNISTANENYVARGVSGKSVMHTAPNFRYPVAMRDIDTLSLLSRGSGNITTELSTNPSIESWNLFEIQNYDHTTGGQFNDVKGSIKITGDMYFNKFLDNPLPAQPAVFYDMIDIYFKSGLNLLYPQTCSVLVTLKSGSFSLKITCLCTIENTAHWVLYPQSRMSITTFATNLYDHMGEQGSITLEF